MQLHPVCTAGLVAEPSQLGAVQTLNKHVCKLVGHYMACRLPLMRCANGNGNGNGIPFPFVSVTKIFESSVSIHFR